MLFSCFGSSFALCLIIVNSAKMINLIKILTCTFTVKKNCTLYITCYFITNYVLSSIIHHHEHASLLRVVTEGEGISTKQVLEKDNQSFEVEFDICGTFEEPKIPATQGRPRMYLYPFLIYKVFYHLLI